MTPSAPWLGLLAWLISGAFTIALSLAATRHVTTGRRSLDLAAFVFMWMFLTTGVTLLAGLAGALSAGALGFVSMLGLIGIASQPRARDAVLSAGRWFTSWGALRAWWVSLPVWLRRGTTLFLAVAIARSAFLIWALPPFIWDSLTYHLTNVAQWIQDGRIGLFSTPIDRIYTPANYEVMASWFTVFLHHDVVVEAAGLPAYLLIGLSVYAIARALGLSASSSWIAVVAHLSAPAVVFGATGTKNDPFVAAAYLFLVALVLELRRRLAAGDESLSVALPVLMTLSLLYALGTKIYILHLFPGLIFLATVGGDGLSLGERLRRLFERVRRDLGSKSWGNRGVLSVLLAGAVCLGFYWNVRNWILTGNPFYPYGVTVAERAILGTGLGGFRFDLQNLVANLQLLVAKFGDKAMRIVPDLPGTTGWGWIAYGLGFPASVWAWLHVRRFRPLAVAFTISLLALLLSSPTSPWNMRYVTWFPAVLAIGLGAFSDRAQQERTFVRPAVAVLLTFCVGMNTLMTLTYNLIPFDEFRQMLSRSIWERHAGLLHVRVPMEYESVYQFVPREARLGYNLNSNGFVYPLYRADFSQRLVYVPFTSTDPCESIAQAMHARGTRYLFVAPEHSDDRNIARLRECARDGSVLRERAIGLYVTR